MINFKQYLGLLSFSALLLTALLLQGCTSSRPAPIRQVSPGGQPAGDASVVQQTGGRTHVVRPGDTLMGISRAYGLDVNDLVIWNGMPDPNQLTVGQTVRLSPPSGSIASSRPVEVIPVKPAGGGMDATVVKRDPQGGTQTYSDQDWQVAQQTSTPSSLPPMSPVTVPPPRTVGSAVWLWPTMQGSVLSTFNQSGNKGIDITGNPGDPVLASAGGKVVYAGGGLRGYGQLIIIKHNDEYLSAYGHNRKLLVKEGDMVKQGQKVAELGSSDADRPKLHFEIRQKGRPVDPMTYLPKR